MRSYEQAAVKLGKRDSRKVANHTYLQRRENGIAVRYHSTDVAVFGKNGSIVLDNGGWITPSTKERINRFSPATLHQEKGLWYLRDGSVFYAGMEVDSEGHAVHPIDPASVQKELKEKKKRIKKYIDGFCQIIVEGKLEIPSNGDCWYCLMFEPHGHGSDDHISAHVNGVAEEDYEKYYVPSLLFNAIKAKGYPNPSLIFQMIQSDGKRGQLFWSTRRILRDYLMKRDV